MTQLELFDATLKPYLPPPAHPAELLLDQIYMLAESGRDDMSGEPDIPLCTLNEIVNMCVEYFYSQDGF